MLHLKCTSKTNLLHIAVTHIVGCFKYRLMTINGLHCHLPHTNRLYLKWGQVQQHNILYVMALLYDLTMASNVDNHGWRVCWSKKDKKSWKWKFMSLRPLTSWRHVGRERNTPHGHEERG